MDLPIKNGGPFHYVSLPEGNSTWFKQIKFGMMIDKRNIFQGLIRITKESPTTPLFFAIFLCHFSLVISPWFDPSQISILKRGFDHDKHPHVPPEWPTGKLIWLVVYLPLWKIGRLGWWHSHLLFQICCDVGHAFIAHDRPVQHAAWQRFALGGSRWVFRAHKADEAGTLI